MKGARYDATYAGKFVWNEVTSGTPFRTAQRRPENPTVDSVAT
jgi:hypothetical protein